MNAEGDTTRPVTSRDVWRTWLPLALSWLMMGIALPLLRAVGARHRCAFNEPPPALLRGSGALLLQCLCLRAQRRP